MIKLQDLRIGNLIYFKTLLEKRIIEVDFGFFSSRTLFEDINNNFIPIKITKKILKNSVFKEIHLGNGWYSFIYETSCREEIEIQYNIRTGRIGVRKYEDRESCEFAMAGKPITELHLLQNYIYFVTGKELKISDLILSDFQKPWSFLFYSFFFRYKKL